MSAALTKDSWVSPEESYNCPHGEQSAELRVLCSTKLSHQQEPSALNWCDGRQDREGNYVTRILKKGVYFPGIESLSSDKS